MQNDIISGDTNSLFVDQMFNDFVSKLNSNEQKNLHIRDHSRIYKIHRILKNDDFSESQKLHCIKKILNESLIDYWVVTLELDLKEVMKNPSYLNSLFKEVLFEKN
ncbi:MAG: hypothetical protein IPJ26_11780 [Bacteroidetes bacterium]|jgi:hypothetical protein|nr:hypothetical protein [Bacteroidota bacterium]